MHDKGNEENIFDRLDFKPSGVDTLSLNLQYTRSWFQTPNSFDEEYHPGVTNPVTGASLGPTDQRSDALAAVWWLLNGTLTNSKRP